MLSYFYIACIYGVVAALVFSLVERLRESTVAHIAYCTGFVWLIVRLGAGISLSGGPGGLIVGLVQGGIVLLFNAFALRYSLSRFITAFGRAVTSDDQIVYRRTYDRAEGAVSRGDYETAAELYRQEIASDRHDLEARRRLAEVLLKDDRVQEAAAQFREVVDRAREPDERCAAVFRLAEVTDEHVGDAQSATQLYEMILRDYPTSRYADYARTRLAEREH